MRAVFIWLFIALLAAPASATIYDDVAAANAATPDLAVITLDPNSVIVLDSGPLTITGNVTILGQGSVIDGRKRTELFHVDPGAQLYLVDITLYHGRTDTAGACVKSSGTFSADNVLFLKCSFENKHINGQGGAIYSDGVASIINSTFIKNFANEGGAIFNNGDLSVDSSWFFGNRAAGNGHGKDFPDARVGGGAGICNYNVARVTASYFEQNRVRLGAGGGALLNYTGVSDLTVINSTFYHNRARRTVGGFLRNLGTVRLAFVSAGPNQAAYYSGNISNEGTLYASHIEVQGARTTRNLGTDNCAGNTPISTGPNFATSSECAFTVVDDMQLTVPSDHGGTNWTMFPRVGLSPLIDAGETGDCQFESSPGVFEHVSTDQRGLPRDDGKCDVGAIEVQADEKAAM